MAIRLAAGLLPYVREYRDGFALQIRGASDPSVAAEALMQASRDLTVFNVGFEGELGLAPGDSVGPKYVSDVLVLPDGPVVTIDASHVPDSALTEMLDDLLERLAGYGLTEGEVARPTEQRRLGARLGPAVTLHLYVPRPDTGVPPPVPDAYLDLAASWLLGEEALPQEAWVSKILEFPATIDAAVRLVREHQRRMMNLVVCRGPLWERVRTVGIAPGDGIVTLGFGGTMTTIVDIGRAAETLKGSVPPLLPQLAFACLQVRAAFDELLEPSLAERREEDRTSPTISDSARVSDEAVPDVFPWQVLGPGHLHRLGGLRREMRRIEHGYAILELARAEDILRGPRQLAEVREIGKTYLAPCLITREEAKRIFSDRWRRTLSE